MNAKLGFLLGVNMTVACLLMQGCKINRGGNDAGSPQDMTVTVAPEPAPAPVVTVTPIEPAPAPVVTVAPVPEPVTVRPVKPVSNKPAAPAKPVAVKTETQAAADGVTVYVVKKGDTFSQICHSHNVKMATVEAANPGLKRDLIRVGQKIKIPSAGAVGAKKETAAKKDAPAVTSAPAPAPAAKGATAANVKPPVKTAKSAYTPYTGETKEYTVRGGDSLGKIAQESGISIRALKELNGLTKDSVRAGQKLKVPAEKVTAAKADAKKPEAPKAAEVKAPEAEAKPAAAPAPAPAPEATPAAAPAEQPAVTAEPKPETPAEPAAAAPAPAAPAPVHVVKEGEDLVSIAIQYGVSPSMLMDLNGIKNDEAVKPGMTLKLPARANAQ